MIATPAVFSVDRLRCEHREDPMGLDVAVPRLSWQMRDGRIGARQTAYEISVATGEERLERADVWNSGRVESGACVLVPYGGSDLKPLTMYYWRVRIWDQDGKMSAWSKAARWETGFPARGEWPASWISLPIGEDGGAERPCRYLQRTFTLKRAPRSARLYIAARGLFEPWLNGARVGRDWLTPGWTDYQQRVEYLTYDITSQLQAGENTVGAILADGWYCGFLCFQRTRNHYGDEPSLIAVVRVVEEDGSVTVIGTDKKWRGGTGPLRTADLYMGETYDARKELANWAAPGAKLTKRVTICEGEPVALNSKVSPPIRVVQEKPALAQSEPAKGKFIYDFGQNMVGVVRLRVTAARGTKIKFRHGEMRQADGTLYVENLRTAEATDIYICRGDGVEEYAPRFTFHGFRYVEISGVPTAPALDAVTGLVLHSDMEKTGSFRCSDPLINQLQSNIEWGQRGNFLDIPTDCPQRDERLGWTGDAQVFIRTASFNFDVASFFTKWMRDIRDAQFPNGSIPDVIPDVLRIVDQRIGRNGSHSGNAAWAEAVIICPWVVYQQYGDEAILRENYAAMKKWMEFQAGRCYGSLSPATNYGDWLATDAVKPQWAPTPCDLVGTAYYAYSAELMQKIAEVLGEADDAARYEELHGKIVAAFQREYVAPSGRIAGDSQTAYLLALEFDLLPEDRREASAGYLVKAIERRENHLSTGFVGTPLLAPVLSRVGRTDLAYQILMQKTFPGWLFPVVNGATTMWERWNSWTPEGFGDVAMNSFNHYAYGAIGEWLYRTVAGIGLGEPGYRHIVLRPEPGTGLEGAEAELECPYGKIESAWETKEGGWRWRVILPPNTTATVEIPLENLTIDGAEPASCEGVNLREGKLELAAGSYEFRRVP